MPDDLSVPLVRLLGRRLTPQHWVLLDVLIAVAAAANAAGDTARATHQAPGGSGWEILRYFAVAAVCAPLPFRRRWPLPVVAVITVAVGVVLALGSSVWLVQIATLAMYSMAAVTPRGRSLTCLTGCVVVVLAGALIGAGGSVSGALSTGLLLLPGGWLVGENARQRRAYARTLAERAAEREAEREERIRQAAVTERMDIARELHDTLAHAMSIITVRSGVARLLIDSQPDEARNALTIIEGTSRHVLQEMRLLLGVLRTPEPVLSDPAAPTPSLDRLPDLLEGAEHAGIPVELTVRGTPRKLPGSIDRSAYRIVQEALTNVMRHAGHARTCLRIGYLPDTLELEITNDGGGTRSRADPGDRPVAVGHGLVGMRERVHLFSGDFTAGPLPTGGFHVLARIPIHEDIP